MTTLSELLTEWSTQDGGPVAVALHREYLDPEIVAHFTIAGEPRSKSRARVTMKNGQARSYTPRQTEIAEDAVGWAFRSAGGRGPDDSSTFGVFAVFMCGTRQRRDVDNMLKLILDGLNHLAWKDDAQVTEVSARLVRGLGTDQARTEVIVYKTATDLTGGLQVTKPCERCGSPIRIYNSTSHVRFCSPACAGAAKRVHPKQTCPTCGSLFAGGPGRMYCSRECESTALNLRTQCVQCGTEFGAPRSFRRKFCSVKCANTWQRGKPRGARA